MSLRTRLLSLCSASLAAVNDEENGNSCLRNNLSFRKGSGWRVYYIATQPCNLKQVLDRREETE